MKNFFIKYFTLSGIIGILISLDLFFNNQIINLTIVWESYFFIVALIFTIYFIMFNGLFNKEFSKKISFIGIFLFILLNVLSYLVEFRLDFYLSQKKLFILNVFFVVSFLIHFFIESNNKKDMIKEGKIRSWQILLLIIITILGGYLRIKNLGEFSIYHDEYFYFSSVKSYLYNGSTTLWDYFNNKPSSQNYNSFLTILTGEFVKLTKFDEFYLRLPFAIIGTLTIPMTFILSYVVSKNYFISFIASYFLVFSDISIYLSRFLRQYSFFIFFVQVIALIMILGVKKIEKINKLNWFYLLSPIILIVFNFLEISAFAISIIPAYLIYFLILLDHIKIDKKTIFITFSVGILFISLDIFSNFKILNIISVLKNNLVIGYSLTRINDYLKWLFIDFKLQTSSMIAITIISSVIFLKNTSKDRIIILFGFFYIPLLFLLFNLYHSRDFRYLSFLLPFLFILIANSLNKIKFNKIIIVIIITVFFIKPSFPGLNESKIFIKAQADWKTNEGKRISSRAVAPKYEETYYFLEKNKNLIKNNDINILVIDGIQYLPISNNIKYYSVFKYLSDPYDEDQNKKVTFELVFEKDTIVLGAYLHWLKPNIFNFVTSNCLQVGNNEDNFNFNYNESYVGRDTLYPNIYICKKNKFKYF